MQMKRAGNIDRQGTYQILGLLTLVSFTVTYKLYLESASTVRTSIPASHLITADEVNRAEYRINEGALTSAAPTNFAINHTMGIKELNSSKCTPGSDPTGSCSQQKPPCSNEAFRMYFEEHGQYPEGGTWIPGNSTRERYNVNFCRFLEFDIQECLEKKNVTKLLVVGDSQGRHYYEALLSHINNSSQQTRCEKLRGEKVTGEPRSRPEVSFFAQGNPELANLIAVETRDCRTCHNEVYECEYPSTIEANSQANSSSFKVLLEFSTFFDLNDTSVTIKMPENTSNPNIPLAKNYAEFLFKVYLLNKYPDIMWFFVPFNHEKVHFMTSEVMTRMRIVEDILMQHKPRHTQVYWFTTTAEVESKRTKAEWINQRFQGKLANEKISAFNRAMYGGPLRHLLQKPKANTFGFHNLYNMSSSKDHWSVDGVHYIKEFYEEVVRGIMSTICHSSDNL